MSMTCQEVREAHPILSDDARRHLSSCADCRAFVGSWEALRQYPGLEPSPGFLRGIRRKLAPRILRFAAAISAAAAALLIGVVLWHAPARETVTEEERELVENLELLQNYELLRTLELVSENGSTILEEKK